MIPISETEILDRLGFDNPWWETSCIEERFEGLPRRAYYQIFYDLLTDLPVNRAIVLTLTLTLTLTLSNRSTAINYQG